MSVYSICSECLCVFVSVFGAVVWFTGCPKMCVPRMATEIYCWQFHTWNVCVPATSVCVFLGQVVFRVCVPARWPHNYSNDTEFVFFNFEYYSTSNWWICSRISCQQQNWTPLNVYQKHTNYQIERLNRSIFMRPSRVQLNGMSLKPSVWLNLVNSYKRLKSYDIWSFRMSTHSQSCRDAMRMLSFG